MDAGAILHELTHAAGLPIEALQAASVQRAEMLPKSLGVIEDYLGQEPAARANPTLLFFIFHLLGEWRERTAYRPLVRLLRCPADEADAIFGDATASTSHRVMAAVFDGDPQPLYDIILDPSAEEFIRSRMCEALVMATLRRELDRNLAERFLRDALLGFDDFEQDLKHGTERPGEPWRPGDDEYEIFGDTIEALSGWHCFTEHDSEDREAWREPDELDFLFSEPHRNPFKGIGRNDPCPCGSGKKFKKCCLQ